MATKDQVLISISISIPFTPEMAYQIKQTIDDKYNVESSVIPSPIVSKPIETSSDTLDSQTLASIEADSTVTLMSLLAQQS